MDPDVIVEARSLLSLLLGDLWEETSPTNRPVASPNLI